MASSRTWKPAQLPETRRNALVPARGTSFPSSSPTPRRRSLECTLLTRLALRSILMVMEPVLLALLCADKVITEEGTHKRSVIGTFNNFHSQKFPIAVPPWFVYVAFTNVSGEHDLTVNIVDRSNDYNVYSANATLNSQETTAQIELSIPVVNASFPKPEKYEVSLSLDGRHLGARTLNVLQIQSMGGVE